MRHTVDYWDTGEMQTVPWILGIAHPTGFPTFVLGGFLFSHLVPIGSVAFRMSLFSGIAMSCAAWCIFVCARELRVNPLFAFAGSLLFATTDLAWSRGTRTEVHALAVAACAILLTLAVRFVQRRDARLLPAIAVAAGLGIGVHPVVLFALLPAAVLVATGIFGGRRGIARPRIVARTIRGVVAGLALAPLLYAYLPLRSAWLSAAHADPTLSLGIPAGRPYWDYDHPSSMAGFLREVSGSDFTVGAGLAAIVQPASYSRIPQAFFGPTIHDIGILAVVLAAIGAVLLPRRLPWPAAAGLLAGGLLAIVFATSFSSESDVARYFLIADWLIALCAALGAQGLAVAVRRTLRYFWRSGAMSEHIAYSGEILRRRRLTAQALVFGVLALAVARSTSLHGERFWQQPADPGAEPLINRIIAETPPNAVVIANWTYATPLTYAAFVEQRLGRRIIETAWPADDAAYIPRWFQSRPVVIINTGEQLPPTVTSSVALDGGSPRILRVQAVKTL